VLAILRGVVTTVRHACHCVEKPHLILLIDKVTDAKSPGLGTKYLNYQKQNAQKIQPDAFVAKPNESHCLKPFTRCVTQ